MRKVSFCDSFSHQKEKIIITKILSPYHGGKLTFRFHRFKNTPFYSVASAQPFWYYSSWNPKKLKFARVQLTGKLWKKLSWFFNIILLKKSRNFFNTSNLRHEVVQMKTDFKSHGNFFSLFFFGYVKIYHVAPSYRVNWLLHVAHFWATCQLHCSSKMSYNELHVSQTWYKRADRKKIVYVA